MENNKHFELKHTRPVTKLFMLQSLDGKISTGSSDLTDFDSDFPNIEGLREGLQQYYDIEKTTGYWSLCTGRTQAKIGVNTKEPGENRGFSFVVLDTNHLEVKGVQYLCSIVDNLVVVTTNTNHPAYSVKADNLYVMLMQDMNLRSILEMLHDKFDISNIVIQSGGTLNAEFVKQGLIDYVDIVVAPVLVGGKDTPTTVDGESRTSKAELNTLGILELEKITPLKDSYIRLGYKVRHNKET